MKILSCQNSVAFVNSLKDFKKKDILFNYISNFEDKEMLVSIENYEELRNQDVLVVQSLSNNVNDAIMELLFTLDIVSAVSPKSIRLLITYMGYSRQDMRENISEPFSAKIIAELFSFDYLSKIYVVDIHAKQTMGFFNRPALDINITKPLTELIKKKFRTSSSVLVSPNSSNLKQIIELADNLNMNYSIATKYRPAANQNKILSVLGADVAEKDCIIIDDVVDSAGTLCNLAEKLARQGANSINAIITHGIFSSKSLERIKNSYITKMYVSNTINYQEKIRYIRQVEEFSISDYVIDEIMDDMGI